VNVLESAECSGLPCSPDVVAPPAADVVCEGETAVLDGTGVGLLDCSGEAVHEWLDGATLVGTGPVLEVMPLDTTTYTLQVSCSTDPECFHEEEVTVSVEKPPVAGAAVARDLAECNLGVEVSWDPATFRESGTGVYNVYRSELSCADALSRPPVVTGLTGTRWVDEETASGGSYVYVVEAEDSVVARACSPTGADHAGPAASLASSCTARVSEAELEFPAGVGATLRAAHDGDLVTLSWDAARGLLAGEHFHLLKTSTDPAGSYRRVNPESDLARSHVETDTSSRVQFFDLRVANECELQSLDEFPPGR